MRLHFMVGAMSHTMLFALQSKFPGHAITPDGAVLLRELMAFAGRSAARPRQSSTETPRRRS